jgi:hypothetical protein
MLKLIGRVGVRVGATALVAAAGLAVTALPASAAGGVDLAASLSAGSVASGSAGKPFTAKVTNLGDTKAEEFDLRIDASATDDSKVTVSLPDKLDEFCKAGTTPKTFTCEFGNALVRNDSLEIGIIVSPVNGGGTGDAGLLLVTAVSDQDGNNANNAASTRVKVTEPGVDIVVWAEDVTAGRDDATGEAKRVAPGGTGKLAFGVANGGSARADGVEIVFTLPEHVSFTETPEDCTVSGRKVTCSLPDVKLNPDVFLPAELDVKVAPDAPTSVELKGTFEGRSLGVGEPDVSADARRTVKGLPGWAKVSQDAFNPNEVDNKDNTDDFVVFVGASTGGGGGGLPTTGPKAIVIGGVGAAALAVGVFLFVAARRRRIVLVTPAE